LYQEEKNIQTLTELGLTNSQAKVYLTLTSLGKATGKIIWKKSEIARQHLYEILDDLQNKGLVEKILASPTEFRAVPLQYGLSILLEHKVSECQKTEKKVAELLSTFSVRQEKTPQKETEFVILQNRPSSTELTNQEIALESIDCLTNIKRYNQIFVHAFELINRDLTRGVKTRLITEKPANEKSFLKMIQPLLKTKNYETRYITSIPKASVAIFDKKRMVVDLEPISEPAKTPRFITNHPAFIEVFEKYFEELWNQAHEYKSCKKTTINIIVKTR